MTDCKLQVSRVQEKIKNVTLGLIEDQLDTFNYIESVKFIQDNNNIINQIVSEIIVKSEHRIKEEFFSLDTRYCIFKPKSPDNFAMLKETICKYFDFTKINQQKLQEQKHNPVLLAADLLNINQSIRPLLIKRAVERVRFYIYEKLEKNLMTTVNPLTGLNYTTKQALIFIEESHMVIEDIVTTMVEEYIKIGIFHRFFTDKNLDLDIDSYNDREISRSLIDWEYTNILKNNLSKLINPHPTKKWTVAKALIHGKYDK